MAQILPVSGGFLSPEQIDDVRRRLRAGDVIAYPTETLYGLGCDPFQAEALSRLVALKGRPEGKPLPLIAASLAAAERIVVRTSPRVRRLWEQLTSGLWPGSLTLVMEAEPVVPVMVTGGTGRVGVRVSSLPLARQLAEAAGGLIVATSANSSGEKVPETAEGVAAVLGEGLVLVVDAGRLGAGAPSTVVDLTGGTVRVLREGAVPVPVLDSILGEPVERPD
jgi:L-threonylcarbamoyladenylate synthase